MRRFLGVWLLLQVLLPLWLGGDAGAGTTAPDVAAQAALSAAQAAGPPPIGSLSSCGTPEDGEHEPDEEALLEAEQDDDSDDDTSPSHHRSDHAIQKSHGRRSGPKHARRYGWQLEHPDRPGIGARATLRSRAPPRA